MFLKNNMKLGIVGVGNMASSIISGMLSADFLSSDSIAVFDVDNAKMSSVEERFGVKACVSLAELAGCSDIILLAVKPNVIGSVCSELAPVLRDKLVISIAAGKKLSFYEGFFFGDNAVRIVRVMPNINALVGESISAFCCNEKVTDDDKRFVGNMLNSFGKSLELPEELFSIYSAVGGCSPAFVFMFIDALSRAGVKYGMKKSDSLTVAAQAVLGSAKTILESSEHPWELVDRVCSPGGTTIEGVASLEGSAFTSAVEKAVEASYTKDKKL